MNFTQRRSLDVINVTIGSFDGMAFRPILVLTGLIVFLLVGISPAATYYVSEASGSDARSGFASQPWKTLGKACAAVQPGDSVLVLPGRYVDPTSTSFRAFNPARAGRSDAKIVFKSQQLHKAVLAGRDNNKPAFGVDGKAHIVLDGFKVEGGIGLRARSDYGIIKNCDVIRGFIQSGDVSLHWGIYIAAASYCQVINNRVHSPGSFGNKTHNGAAIMVIGVPGNADHNLIQNNDADCGNKVWYGAYGQKAGLISNNTWKRNIARGAVTGFLGMGSTDNTKFATGNRYSENIALNCTQAFELDHNCTAFLIFNNTAYNCDSFLNGGYRADSYGKNTKMEVWNNVFHNVSASSNFYKRNAKDVSWTTLLAYSDYNNALCGKIAVWNYNANSYATLNDWQGKTVFDPNSMSINADFMDPASINLRLKAGSKCINKGVNRNGLSPGLGGKPPDLGAYPRGDDGTLIGLLDGSSPIPEPVRPPPRIPTNLDPHDYDPIPD